MIDIINIRRDFPLFQTQPNMVYLDSAASSLKVKNAIDRVDKYYQTLGVNVHRGTYDLSYQATNLFEESRQKVANFVHADLDEIVFTRGATSALNMVAHAYRDILHEGDEIITSELEHHSSLLPWMMVAKHTKAKLVYLPLTTEGRITVEGFKTVLSSRTKVVALTHLSNVMGYITPIKEIAELAHEQGSIVVLDSAQSIPHMRVDVKNLDIDYMAFSGHKMFGPSGVGVLYGKKSLLDQLEPFEYGGEMVDQVTLSTATWKDAPMRLEAGTPVISGAIGLAAAIEYIENIGFESMHTHVHSLHQYALKELHKIEGITIYNPHADHAIIAFNVDGVHPHDIATILDQHHVSVRAGHHCAQLVSKFLGVNSTLRVSFHLYNDFHDVDTFIQAVKVARDFFHGL